MARWMRGKISSYLYAPFVFFNGWGNYCIRAYLPSILAWQLYIPIRLWLIHLKWTWTRLIWCVQHQSKLHTILRLLLLDEWQVRSLSYVRIPSLSPSLPLPPYLSPNPTNWSKDSNKRREKKSCGRCMDKHERFGSHLDVGHETMA